VAEPSDADKDTDAEGNALSSDSKDSDATTKADKPHAAPAAATGLKPTSSTTNDPSTSTANAVAATDQSASLNTMAAMDDGDSDDTAAAVTGVPTLTADDTAAAAQLAGVATPASATASGTTATKTAAAPPLPARTNFVATNEPSIVKAVKTELLPTGGTMQMRLDPPELGVLQVSVHVKDGVVSASFQTSNDEATKLLSHSMGQLKTALESQGVTIGKMHVQQTPKEQATSNQNSKEDSGSSSQSREGSSSRQDEQRREALKRMWERLSLGGDPLDLVA
jgi:flagellar hook-length control protein FliK